MVDFGVFIAGAAPFLMVGVFAPLIVAVLPPKLKLASSIERCGSKRTVLVGFGFVVVTELVFFDSPLVAVFVLVTVVGWPQLEALLRGVLAGGTCAQRGLVTVDFLNEVFLVVDGVLGSTCM